MAAVYIYGFGPYMSFRDNVTERTVRALPRIAGVQRRVFEVKFDRAMFERALARARPDIVIGLGQHPRARKLRLEQRSHPRGNPRVARFVSLRLPRTADTTVTYDAGDYVCNFSMWVAGAWCARSGARFAFIHVPRDYAPARLVRYLRLCLRKCRTDAAARSSPRGRARSR
jgi:pyrrolidone-carboxylate peptidase